MAETGAVHSPPPVAPKRFSARRISGGLDTPDGGLEIVKIGNTDKNNGTLVKEPPPFPHAVYCGEPSSPPPAYDQDLIIQNRRKMPDNDKKPPTPAKKPPVMSRLDKKSPGIISGDDQISNSEKNNGTLVKEPPPFPHAVYHGEPSSPPPAYDRDPIIKNHRKVTIQREIRNNANPVIFEKVEMEDTIYMAHQPMPDNDKKPPMLPKKPPMDPNYLMNWWTQEKNKTWEDLSKDFQLKGKEERKMVAVKARRVHTAIHVHKVLLNMHGETLASCIDDLRSTADSLDQVSKKTKIAGITGGTSVALGGVAAAAGVILSPFTLGASLALTAVGVGVAAAGGVTGASAAIAHKVNVEQVKKKIEKIFQEYTGLTDDISGCLKFIEEGLQHLRQHDPSILYEVITKTTRLLKVGELVAEGKKSARALEANSETSGMVYGFTVAMDMYFTKGKKGPKLKKGLASKFAHNIRTVTEVMNKGMIELMNTKDMFD